MKPTPEQIRKFAIQATKASAKLENRQLPDDYQISDKVKQFLSSKAR